MNVLVIDCETTGTQEPVEIIEICLQQGLEVGSPQFVQRFQPTGPMSPAAEAVHRISLKALADQPRFGAHVVKVVELFRWAEVIAGYNVEFDLKAIEAEVRRWWPLQFDESSRRGALPDLRTGKHVVDGYRLWQKMEPRSLVDACRRFVGAELEGAHSAAADVTATGKVIANMLQHFNLADLSWAEVSCICFPSDPSWIGPTHHLIWDERRECIVFGFGKLRGQAIQMAGGGYVSWILKSDFPDHVKELVQRAQFMGKRELAEWWQGNR